MAVVGGVLGGPGALGVCRFIEGEEVVVGKAANRGTGHGVAEPAPGLLEDCRVCDVLPPISVGRLCGLPRRWGGDVQERQQAAALEGEGFS